MIVDHWIQMSLVVLSNQIKLIVSFLSILLRQYELAQAKACSSLMNNQILLYCFRVIHVILYSMRIHHWL